MLLYHKTYVNMKLELGCDPRDLFLLNETKTRTVVSRYIIRHYLHIVIVVQKNDNAYTTYTLIEQASLPIPEEYRDVICL